MDKMTVRDVELKGRRLLMRVDYNVPLNADKEITDDKRIRASLPTIEYVLKQGARLILMSHLGRPKGKPDPEFSLQPVADKLGELLGKPVTFAPDCIGEDVESLARGLKDGDVLLLENVRFHKEETDNDPEFAKKLARLGDVYANDAFGSAHRAHASTEGVTRYFDTCVSGFLMQKELEYLGKAVADPKPPFVAVLGGAKISDKIPVIENLLKRVDKLLIGGGMMFTFLKAKGLEIGKSLLDAESLDFAARIVNESGGKIVLPVDCVVTGELDIKERKIGKTETVPVEAIPPGTIGVDIGPESVKAFSEICRNAGTVVWNGPMGVFEIRETAKGTFDLAQSLAEATQRGAVTIIGGGDSASAVKKAGLAGDMTHVSTGGGASLEFLEGKTLPGVEALTDRQGA